MASHGILSTRKCCDTVPLRTVQTHYLHAQHGIATSMAGNFKMGQLFPNYVKGESMKQAVASVKPHN